MQTYGAKIDDSGLNVEIDQPLIHDAALGGTIDGGLTKSGTGTLLLGAVLLTPIPGPPTINNGTLALGTAAQIDVASAISTRHYRHLPNRRRHAYRGQYQRHTAPLTCTAGSTLNVTSIYQGTLTMGNNATLNIAAISGGYQAVGSISPVPEPATWAMLMLAAMGLGIYWRRSR